MQIRPTQTLTTLALLGLAATAHAQNVAAVKAVDVASATATPAASLTGAVVTQIIGTPTTTETFLAQDSTGAIEVYKASTTTYAPAVGDTVSVSGVVTSFHGLFELEGITGTTLVVTNTGTGAAAPAPAVFTVAGLQNGSPVGLTQQSMLGTLSTVTFTGANATGSFTSGGTYTVTDSTGLLATVYVPSTDTVTIGSAIPTGAVNINGYLGQFGTTNVTGGTITGFGAGAVSNNGYEIVPLSFTPATVAAAPEPSGWVAMIIGMGALGLIVARRRSQQAA